MSRPKRLAGVNVHLITELFSVGFSHVCVVAYGVFARVLSYGNISLFVQSSWCSYELLVLWVVHSYAVFWLWDVTIEYWFACFSFLFLLQCLLLYVHHCIACNLWSSSCSWYLMRCTSLLYYYYFIQLTTGLCIIQCHLFSCSLLDVFNISILIALYLTVM